MLDKPISILKKVYINLDRENSFSVELKNITKDYFLVIDIYPVENPRHPDRHPGWYRFDNLRDGKYTFKLDMKNGIEVISDDGIGITDFWKAESAFCEDILPISVKIVIRKKINNEIVSENKILTFKGDECFNCYKAKLEEFTDDFTEFVPTKYIIPCNMEVKIILKSLADRDAIGYFVKQAYALLKSNRIKVSLYAQYIDDYLRPFVHTVDDLFEEECLDIKNKIILYNYSISDEYLDRIINLPYKKIVYYHGITAPDKLKVFDALLAQECQIGLENLYRLASFDKIITNSKKTEKVFLNKIEQHIRENIDIDPDYEKELSKSKLKKLQDKILKKERKLLKETKKKLIDLPPTIIQKKAWEHIDSDNQFEKSLLEIGNVILFVGRIFPHKKVEETIEVFRRYLKLDENAVLALVGGSHNSYQKYLQYKIDKFSQNEKERIIFLKDLSSNQMKAVYKAAKAFVTMSEDEGFCVPILEAMNFDVPVVAKLASGSAVNEVLGSSGKLVIDSADKESIAEELYKLNFDRTYRKAVIRKQNNRLKFFDDEILAERFLEAILELYYADKSFN